MNTQQPYRYTRTVTFVNDDWYKVQFLVKKNKTQGVHTTPSKIIQEALHEYFENHAI